MKVSYVSLAWFASREDYDAIKLVAGAKDMPSTYDEWLILAKEFEKGRNAVGIQVIRGVLKKDEFLAHCSANGLKINSKVRMDFAAELARRWLASRN